MLVSLHRVLGVLTCSRETPRLEHLLQKHCPHMCHSVKECVCVSYMFSLSGLQGLGRVVVELGSTQSDPVFGPRCHLEAQVKMRSHTLGFIQAVGENCSVT